MTRCIIVEDEKPARELLQMYIEQMPGFQLAGAFENAVAAFSFLQSQEVDLMFLDIHMPRMSGLQLLQSLKASPKVIITTAFREYAVEGFELDVLDYLLKPISQDRFMKAISKFNYYRNGLGQKPASQTIDHAYIFLKIGKDQIKVFLKDIVYIEGLKDYIKVFTTDKMYIAYDRMGYMAEKLPDRHFVRIHKSHIISVDKITNYNHDMVRLGDRQLPIGRVYKQAFLRSIEKV